ncbi:MAG: hypothetical protein WC628_04970 [Candidatus Omnitrophota bacterium]
MDEPYLDNFLDPIAKVWGNAPESPAMAALKDKSHKQPPEDKGVLSKVLSSNLSS